MMTYIPTKEHEFLMNLSQKQLREMENGCARGDADALYNFASLNELGSKLVDADPFKALVLYEEAAAAGNAKAAIKLGWFYEFGFLGVCENLDKAMLYYKKAWDRGIDEARFHLCRMRDKIKKEKTDGKR